VETAGKVLLIGAAVLAIVGVGALLLAPLSWKPSDNVRVFVPIGLMVVVSIVGTILLNLFLRR
jgi:hypothetical protein